MKRIERWRKQYLRHSSQQLLPLITFFGLLAAGAVRRRPWDATAADVDDDEWCWE